ncbi:hypothetical protein [Microvirga sp. G4-2]|uniref:hypothetical protein n=1 Tax=Microvirga sp. G4-2 TaxID=3434467 RepID=UPI004043FACD
MSDTMAQAIRAAEGFLVEVKTPRLPGGKTPAWPTDWLKWHGIVVSRADGNRSRLRSLTLAATPEELDRSQALQAEILVVAEASQAEADVLAAKRY